MPILSLDVHQRLNLFVLVGLPEAGSIHETWAAWKLMDRLMLNDEEKQAVEFQPQLVNGYQSYIYNRAKVLPAREFDFDEAELGRIQRALYGLKRILPGEMRSWLEPLLAQVPAPAETNGHNPQ